MAKRTVIPKQNREGDSVFIVQKYGKGGQNDIVSCNKSRSGAILDMHEYVAKNDVSINELTIFERRLKE